MSEKVSALIAYAAFCETASETSSSSITDMALLQKDVSNSAQAILEMMRHGVVCLRHSKDGKSDESEKEVENVLSLVPLSCLVTVAKAESKPYFKIQASANNACASFSLLSTAENKTHALLHSRLMLILQIIVMSDLYDELIVDSAVEDGLMDLCLNLLTIRDDARYIWPKGNEDYIDVCLVDDEDSSNATADVAMIVGTEGGRSDTWPPAPYCNKCITSMLANGSRDILHRDLCTIPKNFFFPTNRRERVYSQCGV